MRWGTSNLQSNSGPRHRLPGVVRATYARGWSSRRSGTSSGTRRVRIPHSLRLFSGHPRFGDRRVGAILHWHTGFDPRHSAERKRGRARKTRVFRWWTRVHRRVRRRAIPATGHRSDGFPVATQPFDAQRGRSAGYAGSQVRLLSRASAARGRREWSPWGRRLRLR